MDNLDKLKKEGRRTDILFIVSFLVYLFVGSIALLGSDALAWGLFFPYSFVLSAFLLITLMRTALVIFYLGRAGVETGERRAWRIRLGVTIVYLIITLAPTVFLFIDASHVQL